MILLSSFMVLLHKYSRQEDVVVGSSIAGRTHQDTENIVGMFVNTLPMRAYPESNKSFKQLLNEVKDVSLKAYDHQEYPLEELVDEIVEKRDLTRNPLFDVLFTLQNNEKESLDIEDWIVEPKEATNINAKFDLNMMIEDDGDYKVSIEYGAELFEHQTVERMLAHYIELLANVVQQPEHNIGDINMATADERTLILGEFNNTRETLDNRRIFMDHFEAQVEQTPNRTAIVYEGESLTYQELNDKANQLAYKLRAEGVKPNMVVGMLTQRSLEMMIGIYGILKAGGAYVPIDPHNPTDRINYMLNDSQPKILLTDATLDEQIEYEGHIINLADKSKLEHLPTENLPSVVTADDLMYIIYTSGTTGNPKGVIVSYEGVMNRINWMIKEFDINSEDKVLFKTLYTFDVSVWEIFGFAMVGAQLVLLPSGEEGNPDKLATMIQEHEITMVHFVPSMLGVFIDYIKSTNRMDDIASINYIPSSGEALKPEQVNRFNDLLGRPNNSLLIDLYGPTEASIEVVCNPLYPSETYDIIPIGRPISNVQIYILNEKNNLMGIGVPGELCIGGIAVTHGYLNRPGLTEQQFIDNPFGEGKLYRSGDLAKWRADGELEYIGRIDEQVKIRGYRIELGEIASHLRRIDGISDVGVIVRQMVGDDLSICAYLVSDQEISFSDIKAELGKKVPDYMVPAYMMQIEQLPLTANGKLNKRALPEIEVESKTYVEPRNATEATIVEAVKHVLNVEQVGVYDNFFEIGGDSIKAIKLTSELSKTYNISIKDLFELQTIERISEALDDSADTNLLTKLASLKEFNLEQPHQFSNDFIQEIESYKENSAANYEVIDVEAVKSNKMYYSQVRLDSLVFIY